MTILPATTFGNVYWYATLLQGKNVVIDPNENFVKQSYRSRFSIATSQGVKLLSVPVQGQKGIKTPLAEIQIIEDDYWKAQHLKTIESAYNSSPFYLYYQEDLKRLYQQDYSSLLAFNLATIKMVSECLDLDFFYQLASNYISACPHDLDLRPVFKPSLLNKFLKANTTFPRYIQVFEPKLGFQPNLSILDLLFNLGPETTLYLEKISQ